MLDALRDAGLEPCGALLSQGGGQVWCATSVEGVRFRARVAPPAVAGAARARALRLAALDPLTHLARVAAPVPLADDALLLLEEEVEGVCLDLLDGPWEPGEVTAVLVCAAQALAALHTAGLAHGRVRLRHLVRRPDAAVVLTGLLAADPAPGRGPEQDADDLVRLGLSLLEDTVPGEGRDRLAFALTEMPPGADVQAIAERAVRACPARPVRAGAQAVVVDELRRLARSRRAHGGVRSGGRLARRPARGRHRARRTGLRPPVVVSAVGTLGVLSVALVLGTSGGSPSASARVATSSGTGAGLAVERLEEGPVEAARRLTVQRAEALATGDAPLLGSVTVPGSPAARADAAVAADLAGDVDAASLRVVVHDVVLLERGDGVARVAVTASAGARPAADEGAREEAPARSVVLVLHEGHAGWRVHDVLD
ncbi:hypothetical protein GXB85_03700 [Cellulomonas sp. APG4]|uniref:hypothetical protein n=1 Tax=Cellulomonas sp. APG4 TaxID=1538656 RepID=UPI00137AE962|nr:hypothetical protein [Cellulomonas sp. APG4]NCT90061.1 hypothetical protein [Cellulomonas sp. APG4]